MGVSFRWLAKRSDTHSLKGKFGKQTHTGTIPGKLVMTQLDFFFIIIIYVGMHMIVSSTDTLIGFHENGIKMKLSLLFVNV